MAFGAAFLLLNGGVRSAGGQQGWQAPQLQAGSPTSVEQRRANPQQPAAPPAGSRLVFQDDFTGRQLDPGKWIGCFPWAPSGCTNPPTGELEWFTPSQATVSDGVLRVTAERQPILGTDTTGKPRWYEYRSANVTTAGKFSFTYGYVRFEARFPVGMGLWPAVWMLPVSQQPVPEIDLLEVSNRVPGVVNQFFHGTRTFVGSEAPNLFGWHTYSLDWRPETLTFAVDGVKQLVVTDNIPHEAMYLLASLSVGGLWPGSPASSTPFPSSLELRHLQVWQR